MAQLKSSSQTRIDAGDDSGGAAAEVAAGRTNSVKRADGSWSARVRNLPQNYALQTWADSLAIGSYDVNLTVAQNGLPTGWWYIEVLRHTSDTVTNQYRYLRATPLTSTLAAQSVHHCSVRNGTWSAWTATTTSTNSAGLGVGQTWQDMTASRAANVTYTNTAGRSISIRVYCSGTTTPAYTYLNINGMSTGYQGAAITGNTLHESIVVSEVIPSGSSYAISNGGTQTLVSWWELR